VAREVFTMAIRRSSPEADREQHRQLTREHEHRVADDARPMRDLTTALVRAEHRERRRLSEALHDDLQQLLYGVQLKLRLGLDGMGGGCLEDAQQQLLQAESLLLQCIHVTRRLGVDLNPPILKNEGLKSILVWLQEQVKFMHGLEVELEGDEIRVDDDEVRVLLYQAFRELLFNVAKHSGARSARVSLREGRDELCVDVADDGAGFDVAAVAETSHDRSSLGLASTRERLELVGGRLDIASRQGSGTRVTVRIPRTVAFEH
jgi:signal transduction histidine kinase